MEINTKNIHEPKNYSEAVRIYRDWRKGCKIQEKKDIYGTNGE